MDDLGRIWNCEQTARYLGKSPSWLRKNSSKLERAGFPKVDNLLGGRDSQAVMRFCDKRSGMVGAKITPSKDILRLRAKFIANDNKHDKT